MAFSVPGTWGLSQRAQSIGVKVSDTTSDTTIAAARVIENSLNKLSMIPPINRIDKNTATSETFMESKVKPTSLAPRYAAFMGEIPASICREMFSSTTMASSTTSPVARIRAISDRLFSEKPNRYMMAKVPTSDTGTARVGISEARKLPRNRNTTRITSATAISKVISASCSVALMTGERSMARFSLTLAGRTACKAGNWALIALTVSMMLAPA